MIKKIIYLLTIIIAIAIVNLSYYSINDNDYFKIRAVQDYIALKQSSQTIALWTYFDKSKIDQNLTTLIQYCEENQITMLMQKESNDEGISIMDFYVYGNDNSLFDTLKLNKNEEVDFSNITTDQYYTTRSHEERSSGTLLTIQENFFETSLDQFRIHNMANVKNAIEQNDNEINVCVYLHDREASYNQLMSMLKTEGISAEDMAGGYAPAQLKILEGENVQRVQSILVLSTVLIGLLLAVYFLKSKREMMIKRLNGVSILNIIVHKMGMFFFINIFIFGLTLFLTTLLICGSIHYTNKDLYELNIYIFL